VLAIVLGYYFCYFAKGKMSNGKGSSHQITAFVCQYCKQKMLWLSYTHVMKAEMVMKQK
jgi:hypothetical protein